MPILPSLSLRGQITRTVERGFWSSNDNTGDPFVDYPYQWEVTLTIQPQNHNNYVTDTPYAFTGMDVKVGDWYASGVAGRAVQIIEIIDQQLDSMVCVVEDYERYNLFTDPYQQGYGMVDTGNGIIFRLGEDGLPIFGPVEEFYLPNKTFEDLMARFISRNSMDHVLVKQALHGFLEGDVIYADFETDVGYKKVNAANFDKAIGIVTEISVPGLDYFRYRPLGRLITNVNPPLWGSHGDVFYLDPNEPGALTNVKPQVNAVAVYLQLELPTKAILLERGAENVGSAPSVDSETYKYDVENVVSGQTTFTLPANAKEVLYMAINGIENENFTFNTTSKVLNFDPIETGYGVDVDDEIFFIYKT